jgi:hypothetical protein
VGGSSLHLGVKELATDLQPSLSFWRDVGRAFVGQVCSSLDPTDPSGVNQKSWAFSGALSAGGCVTVSSTYREYALQDCALPPTLMAP